MGHISTCGSPNDISLRIAEIVKGTLLAVRFYNQLGAVFKRSNSLDFCFPTGYDGHSVCPSELYFPCAFLPGIFDQASHPRYTFDLHSVEIVLELGDMYPFQFWTLLRLLHQSGLWVEMVDFYRAQIQLLPAACSSPVRRLIDELPNGHICRVILHAHLLMV